MSKDFRGRYVCTGLEKVISVAFVQLLCMLNNVYNITSTVHNHSTLMF